MSNQLWAWEYEGKTEVGIKSIVDKQEFFAVGDWISLVQGVRRTTYQVTNLRKVKVVDEDAVVSGVKADDLDFILEKAVRALPKDSKIQDQLASVRVRLQGVTPPITEPKNFGAIVEAQYFGYNSEKYLKARFFNNGRDWILEGTLNNFAWSDLINPIIISEGVEG